MRPGQLKAMITNQQQPIAHGHRISTFELNSVLGAGGFGITYKAIDLNLQRAVAIKEYFPVEFAYRDRDGVAVKPRAADFVPSYRAGLKLFLREARTLAKFRHPSIVRISQLLLAANTAYIVMDYERGETLLTTMLANDYMSSPRINQIAHDVLAGLTAVHAQAITHGDVTPKNIFLREDGTAVLLDFGATRSTDRKSVV